MWNASQRRQTSRFTHVFGRRGRSPLPLIALLASAGGSAGLLAWGGGGSGTSSNPDALPAAAAMVSGSSDTVLLYGPRHFTMVAGGQATYAERFEVQTSYPNGYTLMIQNGLADGSGKVDSALIILNSHVILSAHDFAGGPSVLTRSVTLTSVDTLVVSFWGSSQSSLDGSIFTTPDPSFTVYGPRTVEIVSGSRTTVNDSFPLPADAKPPYRLHLVNGDPDGSHRVSDAVITLNGVNVVQSREIGRTYENVVKDVTLLPMNHVTIDIRSNIPARVSVRFSATDSTAPVLTITSPTEGAAIGATQVDVSGTIQDKTTTQVTVNGIQAAVTNNTSYAATVPLPTEGANALHVTATDAAGNHTDSTRNVIRDTQPPVLTVNAPSEGLITNQTSVTVSGSVLDATAVTVNANGVPLPVDGSGQFTGSVALNEGVNYITVTATDAAGNTAPLVTRTVTRDTQAPVLTVTQPADGASTTEATITVSGTVQDLTAVTVTANGQPLPVAQDGSFSGDVPLVEGPNTITVVATDAATNSTTVTRTVTRTTAGLPPDPSTVAPPIDMTVATTTFAATEFLYTGSNPIQTGVDSGTIDPVRVAVVRGRVMDRAGQPVSGVTVNILNHPELGQTLSRVDGRFDLAVNGGGPLTVNYQKAGLLPVQRTVDVPWQDYLPVDDVVMVGLDTAVTTVDFAQPIEVARGTPQTDSDGTRQATLLFKQGTTATMVMPDSSTQPLTSLHVRATEYTVGPNGPQAMPVGLPPASVYTYAAELSSDEAIAAGARSVQFSQPVALYVENFLRFPVGYPMPVGTYDPTRATWVPEHNGRVIAVLDTTGGIAALDIDGDGVADDSLALSALGINDAERQQLAGLYAPGQSLWRATLTHFSSADLNSPSGPDGALPPQSINGLGGGPTEQEGQKPDQNCESGHSIIECQSQVFGERVPIVGTPFTLNYRSDRVPGRVSGRELTVGLTGPTVSPSLERIRYEITVAGQVHTDSAPALPNQVARFTWDGKDAYGRAVQGSQVATVRISYFYPGSYRQPAVGDTSFGLPGDSVLPGTTNRIDNELVLVQRFRLGTWDARGVGLGGWTLDVHHTYDPVGRVLYLGDGSRRSANSLGQTITTVAGSGPFGYSGDGGPATAATLNGPQGMVVGPDGNLYIADSFNSAVRKVTRDGVITTVAGTGGSCNFFAVNYNGDEIPATTATLNCPARVAFGPDGSLYIADALNHRVRRVGADGIIHTVAGRGAAGFSGDGGLADTARLNTPHGLAFGPDGGMYIVDARNNRIRLVTTDGIIHTIAGTNVGGYNGDGIPAVQAELARPSGIALGPRGEIYIADPSNDRVRMVSPDGIISTVVGPTGRNSEPFDVTLGPDGALYLVDIDEPDVRRLGPDSSLVRIAGTGAFQYGGDGGPPAAAGFGDANGIAFGPDGSFYVADANGNRIRRIRNTLAGFDAGNIVIAAEDGSEFYEFDPTGRHLRTVDGLTGTTRWTFGYGADSLLASATDAFGNVTAIERDGSRHPVAVVGPYGQRTTLAADSTGFLTQIIDPAQDSISLGYYGTDGLLASVTDPRRNAFTVTYDSLGRFMREDDPAGGFTKNSRTALANGFDVTKTSALGRTTSYRVETIAGDTIVRTDIDPFGLVTTTKVGPDGKVVTTSPAGMETTVVPGPDPRTGRQAPLAQTVKTETPRGLTSVALSSRHVVLADSSDPYSLASQTDTLAVNGRVFVNSLNVAQRTFTATTPEGRTSSALIDSLGRVIAEVVPGADTVKYAYDRQGRVAQTGQGFRTWRYSYDARGRLDSVIDPLLRSTTFGYDSAGRVIRQTRPDGQEILFGYDAAGNLTSLTPPSRPAHGFSFTSVNLGQQYDPPGIPDPTPTRYYYNRDQQLDSLVRPDSVTIAFRYDTAGRPSSMTFDRGTLSFGYAPTSGNLVGMLTPAGDSLTVSYDGALPTEVRWVGSVNGRVGVVYNNDFRVASQTVNGTDTVTFGYDRDGLLTSAGALRLGRSTTSGLLAADTLGTIRSAYQYTSHGDLEGYRVTSGDSTLFAAALARDSVGRLIQLFDTTQGAPTRWSYVYDTAGRLAQDSLNGTLFHMFTYDPNGNRLSLTSPNATVDYSYDDQDRLLSAGSTSYTYGPNGELRTKTVPGAGTTTYTYDALGNLVTVVMPDGTQIEYMIDGLNRRVGRKVNGVLVQAWLYRNQLNPAAELDASGNVASRFVYGTRGTVPEYMIKSGVMYRLISDHLGSVRLVVDASTGTVVQRLDYDEWGNVVENTNPGFQPFGFAGGLYDSQTSFVRFGSRDYDAAIGRWTAKDPIGFDGGQSMLYAYASNDPVNLTDASGRQLGEFFAEHGSVEVEVHLTILGGVTLRGTFTSDGFTLHAGVETGADVSLSVTGGVRGGDPGRCSVDASAEIGAGAGVTVGEEVGRRTVQGCGAGWNAGVGLGLGGGVALGVGCDLFTIPW